MSYNVSTRLMQLVLYLHTPSPRHKHWPAGPAHFSDRRASSGQLFSSIVPRGVKVSYNVSTRLMQLVLCLHTTNPRHKHWPAGPVHFSDRRASSGQLFSSIVPRDVKVSYNVSTRLIQLVLCLHTPSHRHKHWPAGPAHFSDRRVSSGQYILSFTGPYRPPIYMSGHQISNSAGPNDDKA